VLYGCGNQISAVCSFVLSQSTRGTDGQSGGQNYDSQECASIAASRGKNLETLSYLNRVILARGVSPDTRVSDSSATDSEFDFKATQDHQLLFQSKTHRHPISD